MIRTYYIDVRQFEDEMLFQEKLCLLSPYRQQKTARLKQEQDRRRSLGAGLALDHALRTCGYGLRERDMEYVLGEWGKPSFREYPQLHFSLSHSGDYAICSIGESPVGNDIERLKKGRLGVAERFFTAQELAVLYGGQNRERKNSHPDACTRDSRKVLDEGDGRQRGEDDEETMQRMFRIWTMKESFLKVTGVGMTLPLDAFSVIVDEERDTVRVEQRFDDAVYQMKEYGVIPGYRAAVCCRAGEEIAAGIEQVVI